MRRFLTVLTLLAATLLPAAAAPSAQVDTTRWKEVDDRLDLYLATLEGESIPVKIQECDLLLEAASQPSLRARIAQRIYDHYRQSPLMGDEAVAIREEDIRVCRSIGRYGLSLLKPGDGLLTHCNAGQLATVKYGTATAPMYLGHEENYHFKIYCDETRPLLQGARLTSFELSSAGMDVTVLCDNMSASLMRTGAINAVFVGCDRVAANGDTANKIGTSMAALAAKRYGVPFYVCAPTSTIDLSVPNGDGIVIEQRKGEEITSMWYEKPMVPEAAGTYNPAFDVTDADLITGIVTEFGIAYPPYEKSLKEMFLRKEIRQTAEEIAARLGC